MPSRRLTEVPGHRAFGPCGFCGTLVTWTHHWIHGWEATDDCGDHFATCDMAAQFHEHLRARDAARKEAR